MRLASYIASLLLFFESRGCAYVSEEHITKYLSN